jgi:ubiquinone/menaquinone biosynthesis C-methylase UbiE
MNQDNYQLSNHAAQIYETQKVDAIFRPLAEATLRELSIDENDLVLDVACGTGIISRHINKKMSQIRRVAGVDLNKSMIDVAKELTKDRQEIFEWHQADVVELPFHDNTFTFAICQQGLQFFPDKVRALTEIRRVLKADGQLALTVWSAISPFFAALAEALADNVSNEIAERSLSPFAFRDEQVIRTLVKDAGFTQITSKTITIKRKMAAASMSIPKEIAGNPVGSDVEAKGQEVMNRIVKQVEMAMQPYQDGNGFTVPQDTYLLQALA